MNRSGLVAGVVLGAGVILALTPQAASAHPLGNVSVNQYAGLDLYPDRIEVTAVIDIAELPTLQQMPAVDADGSGTASPSERAAYAAITCSDFATDFEVLVSGERVEWDVIDRAFEHNNGSAGLATSRLDCRLVADAALDASTTVDVRNRFWDDRVGWRELVAAGHGVRILDSPLPGTSVSDELRDYPEDLLSSPLDVREARLPVEPGPSADQPTTRADAPSGSLLARWTASAERTLFDIVGEQRLTPLVGGLAVLLAVALGIGHAALPGHGKTVMAAYLAGRQGRPRDAIAVGATVTLTHTGGVLVLGLVLTTVAGVAGDSVLGWLGLVSGVIVAAVGGGMVVGAWRRRASHDHPHDHDHHGHGHVHHHHGHDHHHYRRRFGLVGIGIAGGLVPSPSALIVLLAAAGLGHTAFGVLLVLAYGVGMAATLTAAGLVLIRLRDRWVSRRLRVPPRWPGFVKRLSAAAPAATAGLILLVGLGVATRAAISLA